MTENGKASSLFEAAQKFHAGAEMIKPHRGLTASPTNQPLAAKNIAPRNAT